ncbi:MAG: hypothetical protein JSS81_00490 [Acidobacteria bacterium]|nr:hypothetical protein [Acidobacteriota bacterium]
MVRLKGEFDANRAERAARATAYPTDNNQFEVYCDLCGEVFFVNELIFEKVNDALREGFENPFVCEDCRDGAGEYDER